MTNVAVPLAARELAPPIAGEAPIDVAEFPFVQVDSIFRVCFVCVSSLV